MPDGTPIAELSGLPMTKRTSLAKSLARMHLHIAAPKSRQAGAL